MLSETRKFEHAVTSMQIPGIRRTGTPENAHWFLRSGVGANRNHPMILLAICHARRLVRQKPLPLPK